MDRTPTRRRQVLAGVGAGVTALLAGCGSVLGGSGDDRGGQSYSLPGDVTVDWTHTGEEIYDPEFRERTIDNMLDEGSPQESWGLQYAASFVETAAEAADDLRDDGPAGEFVDATDFEESYVLALTVELQPEMGLELADVFYHAAGLSVVAWITGPMASPSVPEIDHLLLRVADEDGPPGPAPPSVDAQFVWPPEEDDDASE